MFLSGSRIISSKSLAFRFTYIRNSSKSLQNSKLNRLLVKMPRDTKHVLESQKQRIKIKEKSNKYVPGTVSLQILGSGSPGTPACVYLFTDQQRYLFNCGEGTQRLAYEHRAKLARLEHIFMTRNSWNKTGGLPGLCLTLQDAGVPNLTLHGPPRLGEIFKAMRRFVVLKDLKVDAVECDPSKVYDDQVMTVSCVPLAKENQDVEMSDEPSRLSPPLDDCTDYYSHESAGTMPQSSAPSLNSFDLNPGDENIVMSYICKLKPKPGPLNLEKCVEAGVPPGPLLGQLKNGVDITLPNGKVVLANDCRAEDDPGPVFIVLDVPAEEYLTTLERNFSKFDKYTNGDEVENLTLVLHFTPSKILNSRRYQEIVAKFPPKTKHLAVNDGNNFSGYVAAHRIQVQLNQLNEHVFPLLIEPVETNHIGNQDQQSNKRFKSESSPGNDSPQLSTASVEVSTALTVYHLRPHHGLDRSIEQNLFYDEYIRESQAIAEFPTSLESLRTEIKEIYSNQLDRSSIYPKITFLGTGSCIPNKTRNVSAILVHTNQNSCILLDCGEGTAGQIIRMYGEEKSRQIFRNLKAIYISHLHADHHIGLIGLLQRRREIIGDEDTSLVAVLAPKQISSWLYFYDRCIEKIKQDYELIPNANLIEQPLKSERLTEMGLNSIRTCPVRHCPHSFGVALCFDQTEPDSQRPLKITYSGDTLPCTELVELGRDSTVLIHEATMEDELVVEARMKMHSTMSQAIEQGRQMNSKYTMLTHFSQRYAKLPRIDENVDKNVSIAFDNMEVTLADLSQFQVIYPTLKLLFVEQCEEMEQKAIKRAFRKQREQLQLDEQKSKIVVA